MNDLPQPMSIGIFPKKGDIRFKSYKEQLKIYRKVYNALEKAGIDVSDLPNPAGFEDIEIMGPTFNIPGLTIDVPVLAPDTGGGFQHTGEQREALQNAIELANVRLDENKEPPTPPTPPPPPSRPPLQTITGRAAALRVIMENLITNGQLLSVDNTLMADVRSLYRRISKLKNPNGSVLVTGILRLLNGIGLQIPKERLSKQDALLFINRINEANPNDVLRFKQDLVNLLRNSARIQGETMENINRLLPPPPDSLTPPESPSAHPPVADAAQISELRETMLNNLELPESDIDDMINAIITQYDLVTAEEIGESGEVDASIVEGRNNLLNKLREFIEKNKLVFQARNQASSASRPSTVNLGAVADSLEDFFRDVLPTNIPPSLRNSFISFLGNTLIRKPFNTGQRDPQFGITLDPDDAIRLGGEEKKNASETARLIASHSGFEISSGPRPGPSGGAPGGGPPDDDPVYTITFPDGSSRSINKKDAHVLLAILIGSGLTLAANKISETTGVEIPKLPKGDVRAPRAPRAPTAPTTPTTPTAPTTPTTPTTPTAPTTPTTPTAPRAPRKPEDVGPSADTGALVPVGTEKDDPDTIAIPPTVAVVDTPEEKKIEQIGLHRAEEILGGDALALATTATEKLMEIKSWGDVFGFIPEGYGLAKKAQELFKHNKKQDAKRFGPLPRPKRTHKRPTKVKRRPQRQPKFQNILMEDTIFDSQFEQKCLQKFTNPYETRSTWRDFENMDSIYHPEACLIGHKPRGVPIGQLRTDGLRFTGLYKPNYSLSATKLTTDASQGGVVLDSEPYDNAWNFPSDRSLPAYAYQMARKKR